MFCYQCEQTIRKDDQIGCNKVGVCTKNPQISFLQDLIVFSCGIYELQPQQYVYSMFQTLTNVNHNINQLENTLQQIINNKLLYNNQQTQYFQDCLEKYKNGNYGSYIGPIYLLKQHGEDINSVIQLSLQALKGCSAYCDHVYRGLRFIQKQNTQNCECMNKNLDENIKILISINQYLFQQDIHLQKLFNNLLQIGQINFKVTELLNEVNKEVGGEPELVNVKLNLSPGPCILISGHDIADTLSLIQQCEKEGINVYTHGELYPSHMYPNLQKYSCFKGNYGISWWNQQIELQNFPGPILFTTNCIMRPLKNYIDRVYSTGAVGYEGVRYIENDNWEELINKSKQLKGFIDQEHCNKVYNLLQQKQYTGMLGFDHRKFAQMKERIIDLIEQEKIKEIYVIGGCDGFKESRDQFKQIAMNSSPDSLILTLACGRFRLNMLELGEIEGIPRLLDVGQCNDVYAVIQIVNQLKNSKLQKVQDIPIHYYIQWYEQKAIVQFITMLSFNIQNIKIGPTIPACISKNILQLLTQKYKIEQFPK